MNKENLSFALAVLVLGLSGPAPAHDRYEHDDRDRHEHRHHGHHHRHDDDRRYTRVTVTPVVTEQRVITTYGGYGAPVGATVVQTTTPVHSGGDTWLNYRISTREAAVLHAYYPPVVTRTVTTTTTALPPGLARKVASGKPLPPGWQRKLRRGQVIDTTVYQYAQPVPVQVVQQLPPQPQGTILVEIDGKIVRLAQATKTIIDILEL